MSIRVNSAVNVILKRGKVISLDKEKMSSIEEERDEGKQTIWGVKLRWVKKYSLNPSHLQ